MIGVYFSGTGNSKYCVECLVSVLSPQAHCYSIEQPEVIQAIQRSDELILAYPIYFSNLPKIMRDFLMEHAELFVNKKVFLLATMGLFSGDGSGCGARLLKEMKATILGGSHIIMPDCIGDEKVLKKSLEQNRKRIKDARKKIEFIAEQIKNGNPPQQGLQPMSRIAGFLAQRCWFNYKTRNYSDKLKINTEKCTGCGLCSKLCPMSNIKIEQGKAKASQRCTLCYRCVNHCPQCAITLLGSKLIEQVQLEKYV